ncbi:MAG: S-methyl-5-thioribose-1-phosphate isomerase [Sphaerochaeta sp.]|jgi:methylthioribose-1-phosphate isomerase|uniref:S-methyl-5-thioribose-1-phosphate isomerase n=1 Tax=Sphaerochaeta sp. TaxID=1972642 RepID=UPI002FC8E2C4
MYTVIPVSLQLQPPALVLLDQTLLPETETFLFLDTREAIYEAIKKLRVRGAPAIGIAAAYGVYVCLANGQYRDLAELVADFSSLKTYLASSRPTAVNLFWALDRMEKRLQQAVSDPNSEQDTVRSALLEEAHAIFAEDQAMSRAIGEHGLSLFDKERDWSILTHCNAGGLATSGYGTALAPLYLGFERGYRLRVYADETRPLLQGSRLTAYELQKAGMDVTVICDNMASLVMKMGNIDAVIVGADRIAANGDAANKIGTSGVAILAKYYGIPFYVAAPSSTFDPATKEGKDIVIEQRDGEEVVNGFGRRTGPKGVQVYNPAFDVTDASLITAIITERGIIERPTTEKVLRHLGIKSV